MKRVVILGAGFSKAIGNLPLTYEMFDRFEQVLEECRQQKHDNRIFWGDKILEFLHRLESLLTPDVFSSGDKVLSTDFRRNFELVLSIIDMNADLKIRARASNGTKEYDIPGPTISNVAPWNYLREWMATYIYLSLIDPMVNITLLEKFQQRYLSSDATVITFNYDLMLESFLYNKCLWYPHDGYGVEVESPETRKAKEKHHSSIRLLKLHGSLNWERALNRRLVLAWRDDRQKLFFPGYLKDEKVPSFVYEGGHSAMAWILPSWVKAIETFPLPSLWHHAARVLEEADEICVIGYSLPPADAGVISLLSCVKFKCEDISLIDPNARKMSHRYSQVTGLKVVEHAHTIEEMLL